MVSGLAAYDEGSYCKANGLYKDTFYIRVPNERKIVAHSGVGCIERQVRIHHGGLVWISGCCLPMYMLAVGQVVYVGVVARETWAGFRWLQTELGEVHVQGQ